MAEGSEAGLAAFLAELDQLLVPLEHRVNYGNLRKEVSEWDSAAGKLTNLALVYETPGGSTDQINVAFHHATGNFSVVDAASEEGELLFSDMTEALRYLRRRIYVIPARRREVLHRQVDGWLDQGRTRGEMFSEVNRLLQSDFRGGSITHAEMQEVIKYIVSSYLAAQENE